MKQFGWSWSYSAPYYRKLVFLSPPVYTKMGQYGSYNISKIGMVTTDDGTILNYFVKTEEQLLFPHFKTPKEDVFKRYYRRFITRILAKTN